MLIRRECNSGRRRSIQMFFANSRTTKRIACTTPRIVDRTEQTSAIPIHSVPKWIASKSGSQILTKSHIRSGPHPIKINTRIIQGLDPAFKILSNLTHLRLGCPLVADLRRDPWRKRKKIQFPEESAKRVCRKLVGGMVGCTKHPSGPGLTRGCRLG